MNIETGSIKRQLYGADIKKTIIELMALLLLTAGISIGYFIVKGGGFFVVVDDFNVQQLTFTTAIQQVISQNPKGEWYWGLDLGSSIISGFSFYNLGSVFFWLAFILPIGSFPYVCGLIYILKYVVAGVTSFFYFKLFVDNKQYAIIGAVLYAFSGFQTVNLEFFHFHDVVALFPLMLLGLELLMKNNKYGPLFILAIFINCVTNYFFFVQEVVFIVLYFVFRFWGYPPKSFFLAMIKCCCYGAVGIGMAAILFLPNVLYVTGTDRNNTSFYLSYLLYNSNNALFTLKGMLFPAEPMNDWSALQTKNWRSSSCYLPLFGLSFVISYLRYCKGWLKYILIFLLLISFSPLLQSGFLMFTVEYQRWWYMLTILLSLATIISLEKLEKQQLQMGIIINLVLSTILFLAVLLIKWDQSTDTLVFLPERFLIFYCIVVCSSVCLFIALSDKNRQIGIVVLLVFFSILTTSLTLHYYRTGTNITEVKQSYEVGLAIPDIDEQFRFDTVSNYYTLEGNKAGIGVFSSTIENSSREFDELFEVATINSSQNRAAVDGLPQLLAGKYAICETVSNEDIVKAQFSANNIHYYVVEKNACPIGFSVEKYIVMDDLVALPLDQRASELMCASVVKEQDESDVVGFAKKEIFGSGNSSKEVDNCISNTMRNAVKDFHKDAAGFRCRTDYSDDRLVYFTVPNDVGWNATIDGERTEIIDSGGMMLIRVPAGNHIISFRYHTPGLRTGLIITIISIIIYLFYCIFVFKNRKNQQVHSSI